MYRSFMAGLSVKAREIMTSCSFSYAKAEYESV